MPNVRFGIHTHILYMHPSPGNTSDGGWWQDRFLIVLPKKEAYRRADFGVYYAQLVYSENLLATTQ